MNKDQLPAPRRVRAAEVFVVSMHFEFKTDTTSPALVLLSGKDGREIKLRFQVKLGYHLFKFKPEDYDDDFGCHVAAREIGFELTRR